MNSKIEILDNKYQKKAGIKKITLKMAEEGGKKMFLKIKNF